MKKMKLATLGFSVIAGLAAITGCSNAEAIAVEPNIVITDVIDAEAEEIAKNVVIDESVIELPTPDETLTLGTQVFIDADGRPRLLNKDSWHDIMWEVNRFDRYDQWSAFHGLDTADILQEVWTDESRTELGNAVFRVHGYGSTVESISLIDSNGNVFEAIENRDPAWVNIDNVDGVIYDNPISTNGVRAIFPLEIIEDNDIAFIRLRTTNFDIFYNFDKEFIADLRPEVEPTNLISWIMKELRSAPTGLNILDGKVLNERIYAPEEYDDGNVHSPIAWQ